MATNSTTTVANITTGREFIRILLALSLFLSSSLPLVLLLFTEFEETLHLTDDIWVAVLSPVCGIVMVIAAVVDWKEPTESVWKVGRYLSCTVLLASSVYFFLAWSSSCTDAAKNCFSDSTLDKLRFFSSILLLAIAIIVGSVK
jgi:hypothetical protein